MSGTDYCGILSYCVFISGTAAGARTATFEFINLIHSILILSSSFERLMNLEGHNFSS